MLKRLAFLTIPLLCFLFVSCSESANYSETFFAMDTLITVDIYGYTEAGGGKAMVEECKKITENCEVILSRYNTNAELYILNSTNKTDAASDVLTNVLSFAKEMYGATNGAYNPALGALVDLWRINDSEYKVIPANDEIRLALSHSAPESVRIQGDTVIYGDEDLTFDLGGIGKGYACMLVAEYLSAQSFDYAILSFGGSITVIGQKPGGADFNIGIKNPSGDGVIGSIGIKSGYVAVSGGYERYKVIDGEIYHHIFDPDTGYPSHSGISSVTVISEDGMLSDALSTALFVMGLDASLDFYKSSDYDFEAVFVLDDGSIVSTEGIADSFHKR